MTRRAPRLTALLAAVLAMLPLAAGCNTEPEPEPTPTATAAPAAPAYPVKVGSLNLDKRPEKIISLSPSVTETLFAIGAGGQVTAVDDNSNFPADAPKSDLSGFQPNAEAIAAKEPDLVILSNDINKIVSQLRKLKIPVYLAPAPAELGNAYQQLNELGALTGHRAEAEALVRTMSADIATELRKLPQRKNRPTYYYELGEELYSATSKTFIGSLFSMAGLDNIADPADPKGAKGGYPQLSEEFIVKANPDFVFLADTKCCGQSPATVKARSGWAGLTAVKKNQVVALDDDIASRWGPRVVDLLRVVADAVAKAPAA